MASRDTVLSFKVLTRRIPGPDPGSVRWPAHVHAQSADREAKFRIEPAIELAVSYNLREKDLSKIRRLIEEHEDEIRAAWNRHFGR